MKDEGSFSFEPLGCHPDTFLASHWGRAPFGGTLDAALTARLPSFADINQLLVRGNIPGDFVRVLDGPHPVDERRYQRPAILRDEALFQKEIARRIALIIDALVETARPFVPSRYLPRQRHPGERRGRHAGSPAGSDDVAQSPDG